MDIMLWLMLWLGGCATGIVGGYYFKILIDLKSVEGNKLPEYKRGLPVGVHYSQWI